LDYSRAWFPTWTPATTDLVFRQRDNFRTGCHRHNRHDMFSQISSWPFGRSDRPFFIKKMFQIYYPGITHCRYLLFAQVARRVGGRQAWHE
jgi:hypothetical protein